MNNDGEQLVIESSLRLVVVMHVSYTYTRLVIALAVLQLKTTYAVIHMVSMS